MVPPAGSPATLIVTSTDPLKFPPSVAGEKVGVASGMGGGASIPASGTGGATSGGPVSGGATGTSGLASGITFPLPPAPPVPSLPLSAPPVVVVVGGGGVVLSSPPHPATKRVHKAKKSRPNHVARLTNAVRQPPTSQLAIALIC